MNGYGYCCCCRCNPICGYQTIVCNKASTGEKTKCLQAVGTWCGGQVTLSGDAVIKRINDQNPAYAGPPTGKCRWAVEGTGRAVWVGPIACRQPVPNAPNQTLGSETDWFNDVDPYSIRMQFEGNISSDWAQWTGVRNGPGVYLRFNPGAMPDLYACRIDADGNPTSLTFGATLNQRYGVLALNVDRIGGALVWDNYAVSPGGAAFGNDAWWYLEVLQSGGLPTGQKHAIFGFEVDNLDPFDSLAWALRDSFGYAVCAGDYNGAGGLRSSDVCGVSYEGFPTPCRLAATGPAPAAYDIFQTAPMTGSLAGGSDLQEAPTHVAPGANLLSGGYSLNKALGAFGITGILSGAKALLNPAYGYTEQVNRGGGDYEIVNISVSRAQAGFADQLIILYVYHKQSIPPAAPRDYIGTGIYEGQLGPCSGAQTFTLVGVVASCNPSGLPGSCPVQVDPTSWPGTLTVSL